MNDLMNITPNPHTNCPPDILAEQTAVSVRHYGFDGRLHDGTIEINRRVADDVAAFFELALQERFPIEKVVRASDEPYAWDDDRLMAANATSGFNYRPIAGTDRVSWHGYGRAFDVNPRQNPYVRYGEGTPRIEPAGADWDTTRPGTLFAAHALVRFMKRRGWQWGGDWNPAEGVVDYQHFQKPLL